MSHGRKLQIESVLKREISRIIQTKIHSDKIGFISILDVKIGNDLSKAKVFYSQLGDLKARQITQKILNSLASIIKGELKDLRLNPIPNLEFVYDVSYAKIQSLLDSFDVDSDAPNHQST